MQQRHGDAGEDTPLWTTPNTGSRDDAQHAASAETVADAKTRTSDAQAASATSGSAAAVTADGPPRRPSRTRTVLLAVVGVVVAFVAGGVVGAVVNDQSSDVDRLQGTVTTLQADLVAANDEAEELRAERDELQDDLSAAKRTIETATAVGDVPSFVGDTARSVERDDTVDVFGWKVRITDRPSARRPGTVVAQTPRPGGRLRRGETLTLYVAVPRPKRWTTIASFSGSGSRNTDEFKIPAGVKVRVNYTFSGDTNAILSIEDPRSDFGGDLLLNEIGDRSGSTRVYDQAGTKYLEIEGGQWTVTVQALK